MDIDNVYEGFGISTLFILMGDSLPIALLGYAATLLYCDPKGL